MIASRKATLAVLALLLADASTAQRPAGEAPSRAARFLRQRQNLSTAVHAARLAEVLDLDVTSAVQSYDQVRRDATKNQPERWLAVARLAELERLGVRFPEPGSLPLELPKAVRDALSLLEAPLPWTDVIQNPRVVHELPALRPASRAVQDWVRDQIGPTAEERRRSRSRERRTVSEAMRRNWRAGDILWYELKGRTSQAGYLRKFDFANWQPPTVTGPADQVLATARKRLAAWIAEEKSSRHRAMLRDLDKALAEQARTSAQTAVAMLRRLPIYGDRLLAAEPAAGGNGGKNDGK